MKRMLFNATYHEELRVALVEGQKLINFDIETNIKTQHRGNIYCGVITRVEPSLEACFVDYGTDKQGFLPFKEINSDYFATEGSKTKPNSKVSEGTKVIVQIDKDERGNKGAALTTYLSLPGRYLVLMPNNGRSGGISRRIDGEEREELKLLLAQLNFPSGMSVIARTAALGRVVEELQWDLNYLLKLCEAIGAAAQTHSRALIYQESNLVIRSIRDHFSPDVEEVLIDEEEVYQEAKNFMASVMPNFVDRIKYYHDDVQLFSRFQVEHQIDSAYSRTVNLPSGGAIVIDHTEALVSVDVNSAKSNKGSDIEATALTTNMEAAEEIARQLRLRDIGGLVVVDFIDMENLKSQRDVENHFKLQLGFDRARIQMGKLSKFGLLELSRQRLQASLEESTTITCPRCCGIGVIRGVESIAVHILRIIQEEAVRGVNQLAALHVQIPVEVATYLLNEKRDDIVKIESRLKVRIVLVPNVHMDSPQYKLRKIALDSEDITMPKKSSFNLVDVPEVANPDALHNKSVSGRSQKAAVKNILPAKPAPIIYKSVVTAIAAKVKKWFASGDAYKTKTVDQAGISITGTTSKSPIKPTINHTNKARPVGVNKTNTRVQTVRPNQKDTTVLNKPGGVSPAARATTPNLSDTRNSGNVQDTARRVTTPARVNSNNTSPRINEPREDNNRVKPLNSDNQLNNNVTATRAVNQTKPTRPDSKPAINQVLNQSPVRSTVAASVAPTRSNEVKPVNNPQPKPTIAVPPARNTIVDPIDLGNLVIVATNKNLPPVTQVKYEPTSQKRHNDVVVTQVVSAPVDYQLVETKK
jgi:ribonuclease E